MTGPANNVDSRSTLLERWQRDGDRGALDELLCIEIAALKARIRSHGQVSGSENSISDVAQEAVLRFLQVERAPTFDTPHALRAYLWKAAWHLLAEQLRRRRIACNGLADSGSQGLDDALATTGGLGTVEARDRSTALDVTMRLLEPHEQEILELVYSRGLDHEGAARELGISRDAAKTRCVRARQRLAHKLRHWSEVIG